MMGFKEWAIVEDAKTTKVLDPDEEKLKAMESEVDLLRKKIRLRKAKNHEYRDIEAVHKAQAALSEEKVLDIEDPEWTLDYAIKRTTECRLRNQQQ
jgi:hypothetical protein